MDIENETGPAQLITVSPSAPNSGPWGYLASPGRIDAFNYQAAKAELEGHVAVQKWLAYDVTGLQFMSYPMIQFLHALAVEVSLKGGRIALIGSSEKLKRQFSIYASLEPFLCLTPESWKALQPQP